MPAPNNTSGFPLSPGKGEPTLKNSPPLGAGLGVGELYYPTIFSNNNREGGTHSVGKIGGFTPILPTLKNSPPLGAGLGVGELQICNRPR